MKAFSRIKRYVIRKIHNQPSAISEPVDEMSMVVPDANWVNDYVAIRDFEAEPVKRTCDKPFRFSVITAVYNTEKYLAECIESIVNQSLDFLENIQLILVNDGSSDGSGEIAKKYARLFPDNIVYVEQKNSGVSSARNNGLKHATGLFLNFTDSDDVWSQDSFAQIALFSDKHPSLGFIATPKKFFGARTGTHPISRILNDDAVFDIRTFAGMLENSTSCSFFRNDYFPKSGFDETMSLSEDFYLVSTLLMSELQFGWASKPIYWYRKHGSDSAIGGSLQNPEYYSVTPYACYRRIFQSSKERFGKVLPYFQFAVMYDLQWRLNADRNACNPPDGFGPYKAIIEELLHDIDPKIIVAQKSITHGAKVYALSLKYSVGYEQIAKEIFRLENDICWTTPDGRIVTICNVHSLAKMWLEFLDYDNQKQTVTLEGRMIYPFDISRISLVAKWESNQEENYSQAQLSKVSRNSVKVVFEENPIFYQTEFKVSFPLEKTSFEVYIDGVKIVPNVGFCKFSPFVAHNTGYIPLGEKIAYWNKNTFIPVKPTEKRLAAGERKVNRTIQSQAGEEADRIIALREKIRAMRATGRRIWIISDRITSGNDNGEALFEYLCENPIPGVEVYFTIDASSPDYERISKIGNVVAYGSDEQIILNASAEIVASSAGEDRVFNPYGPYSQYFKNILPKPKFVFLQHGITKDDISPWINKWSKDIQLFVTSVGKEYESIVSNPRYGYGTNVVKLTGFPRHDKLLKKVSFTEKPNQILICPTWRASLANPIDASTGTRPKYPGFTKSDYFQFFNSLINDKRIEEASKRLGYTVKFILHPSLSQELDEFTSSFCEIDCECNYSDEFAKSAILVTDYSSVAFDFSLLERPVLYAQTDRKSFFEGQVFDSGYFDYDRDGHGPICTDYENTVETLIRYMDNPVMENEYLQRKRDFFPEFENRCKNVVDAILEITTENSNA